MPYLGSSGYIQSMLGTGAAEAADWGGWVWGSVRVRSSASNSFCFCWRRWRLWVTTSMRSRRAWVFGSVVTALVVGMRRQAVVLLVDHGALKIEVG